MLSANNILDYAIITCGGAISNSLGLVFLLFHIAKTYEEYGHPVSRSRTLYFFDDATSMKTIFFGLCCVLNTALLITYFNTIDYEGEDKDPNETNTVSTHSILAVLAIAFLMSLARRLKQNILYIL